jgi:hypothetical protein
MASIEAASVSGLFHFKPTEGCRLLALFGRGAAAARSQLMGVKHQVQTSRRPSLDPTRTWPGNFAVTHKTLPFGDVLQFSGCNTGTIFWSTRKPSPIARQLAAPPMMIFARRIRHPFDVTVQRAHDADARHHRRAAVAFGDQDQRLDRRLPLLELLFGLR